MTALGKRLFSSAILISISVGAMFLAPKGLFFLVVLAFSLLALYEFLHLIQRKGFVINWVLPIFLSLFVPFAVLYSYEGLVFALICLVLFLFHFKRSPTAQQAFMSCGLTIFGIVYIIWFLSYLIKIRYLEGGSFWVFYTVLLAKGGDAGAYFIGSRFGKVKLIEHISPNKSVEGAWGGFFTTLILSALACIFYGRLSFTNYMVLGVLIGIVSQLGDLVESLIKREVGVKDSGVIPGLGGILDVLDSLLFIMPIVYFYLTYVGGIRLIGL